MRLATFLRYAFVALFAVVTVGFQPVVAQATDTPVVTVLSPQSSTIISAERTSEPTFRVSVTIANLQNTDRFFQMVFTSEGNPVAKYVWRSTGEYAQNFDFGLTNTKHVYNGSSYQPVTFTGYTGAPAGWLASRVVPGTYGITISSAVATSSDPSTLTFSESTTLTNVTFASPNGVKCAPGSYNSGGRWTSRALCVLATAGSYVGVAGSTRQTLAPAGSFTTGRGSPFAYRCNYGQYQPHKGRTSCYTAPAGYYVAVLGGTRAQPCAKGSYANVAGGFSCQLALEGRYVSAAGQKTDRPCPLGTYSTGLGSSSCTKARAGYVVASTGASQSSACPLGTYQDKTGQSACKQTTPGHYQDFPASSSQKNCPRGSFTNLRGQRYCLLAEPGTYVSAVAQTSARVCPVGTFQGSMGMTSCDRAPLGSFVPFPRSSEPMQCPVGRYSDVLGSSSCKPCPTGKITSQPGAVSLSACVPIVVSASRGEYVRA